ncbi:hypothetical protein EVAR_31866_1 [Eumeta japonica]|uniref:Odorant receptor n=1 Tax=Eumeta variegata TaxID=151549 RepID=A0A4C1WUY1_EUMVA|nr:hypothetical protein EVAR_31866_1 [Eumeta japonica]
MSDSSSGLSIISQPPPSASSPLHQPTPAFIKCLLSTSMVKEIIKLIKTLDSLAQETANLMDKYKRSLAGVKRFILVFYMGVISEMFIYIPTHTSTRALTDPTLYRMVACVGIGQTDKYPNKGICKGIIVLEIWLMATVLIYITNMFLLLIGHLAAMYELLAEEMTDVSQQLKADSDVVEESTSAEEETQTLLDQDLVRRHLQKVAIRHTLLLVTIGKIKKVYSACTGVDFAFNLITLFAIIILPAQDIVKMFAYLGFAILHFFLYCIACQRLENASQKFERAVYCCGWEDFDVVNRKSVLIMLVQAQKPVKILAAGILPMNIRSFGTGSTVARGCVAVINLIFITYMHMGGIVAYVLSYELDLIAKIQITVYITWYIEYCNFLLWLVSTRPAMKEVIGLIRESDLLANENKPLNEKRRSLLWSITLVIVGFYAWILIEMSFYVPTHITAKIFEDPTIYGTVVCVGMDNLGTNPNKAICGVEVTIYVWIFGTLVMYYTAAFLFLIGYLTVTYTLLAEEMECFAAQSISGDDISNERDTKRTIGLQLDQRLVQDRLRTLIRRYSLLLMTTKKIKNLFSVSIGVDTGVNLTLVFIIVILPPQDILKLYAYIGFAILHMTLYCVACQRLEDASRRFELAVCCCGWEDFDVSNRKSVLVMLMQAQKPVNFPAAGVIMLNVKSLGEGIQALYKFAAAFKA